MSYGLAPRPEPTTDEMAALVAGVQEILRSQSRPAPDAAPSWRFSGRWFKHGPLFDRRPR